MIAAQCGVALITGVFSGINKVTAKTLVSAGFILCRVKAPLFVFSAAQTPY